MKVHVKDVYRCPYTGDTLTLESAEAGSGQEITTGALIAGSRRYEIHGGIPQLISYQDEIQTAEERREFAYYQSNSKQYDAVLDWLFESFYENEDRIREHMVDLLELTPGARVIETGCGSCRDSIRIGRRLGPSGSLFLQDLSPNMLAVGQERMRKAANEDQYPPVEFFVGNASRLPFSTGYFDAAFHFGGLNLFADKAMAMREMGRVVRAGGKVVVGDESMAPWLQETTYGKILLNSNQLYRHEAPIQLVPVFARDVCLRWIIGNSFYVIDFRVGEGEPKVDLDKPILGFRGGTHRSRYYGTLEGVSVEAKEMAHRAARACEESVHDWLDRTVRAQAASDIKRSEKP